MDPKRFEQRLRLAADIAASVQATTLRHTPTIMVLGALSLFDWEAASVIGDRPCEHVPVKRGTSIAADVVVVQQCGTFPTPEPLCSCLYVLSSVAEWFGCRATISPDRKTIGVVRDVGIEYHDAESGISFHPSGRSSHELWLARRGGAQQ